MNCAVMDRMVGLLNQRVAGQRCETVFGNRAVAQDDASFRQDTVVRPWFARSPETRSRGNPISRASTIGVGARTRGSTAFRENH